MDKDKGFLIMKKLIFKILMLFISVLIILIIIWILPIPYSKKTPRKVSMFLSLIINKNQMLAETTPPRIIFIGGSGLFYGLNSEKISKELNVNVVNTGLYAAFSLKFILEESIPFIRKNDIIIIIPEYVLMYSDSSTKISQAGLKWAIYLHPFNYIKYFNKEFKVGLKTAIDSYIEIFQDKIANLFFLIAKISNKGINLKYKYFQYGNMDSEAIANKYGDLEHNFRGHYIVDSERKVFPDNYKNIELAITEMNKFNDLAKSKNAKVYFIFPVFPDTEYFRNRKIIDKYYEIMKRELNIEMLSTPEDYAFAESYFWETAYHLNAIGRELRTEKIIDNLKKINEY
jgi:hypothetical protein